MASWSACWKKWGKKPLSWRPEDWLDSSGRDRNTSNTWTICLPWTACASSGSGTRPRSPSVRPPPPILRRLRPRLPWPAASPGPAEWFMENYFNYFTEIEEEFQRRRGGLLLLSTLDWALIETWKDAGIPLEAVLRGIDGAFDKYDQRPSKTRKVNSLAYCAQEVLAAAEDMKEAAVGSVREPGSTRGFDPAEIAAFLLRTASELEKA